MYDFVSGPLVWIALLVFAGGLIFRLGTMFLLARRERVILPVMDAKYGARSVLHWIVPFASRNMRLRPVFTVVSFAFHACLLLTPLFAAGHAVMLRQSWGINWWSLPDRLIDVMSVVVLVGCVFLILRRISAPEVRYVTDWTDYAIVILVGAPFLTGLMAHLHWLDYQAMVILHMVVGAAWLMVIPFTRLSHMLWFLFSRAYMGSEFGAVRHSRDW